MEVGLFLFGLLLGILLGWRWQGREQQAAAPGHEAEALRQRATAAEGRVRDLEAARDAADSRLAALEAELAAARQMPKAPPPPPPRPARDDLTRIKGIGHKLEERLRGMGITSFRQLAELTPQEAARIDAALEFPGRVGRERWVEQARALMDGGSGG